MKKIDLHVHTNYSDGLYSPHQVLNLAKIFNLDVISITDHDNLDGYRSAVEYAKELNIKLIPGVEISSQLEDREVHILAYNIDIDNEELNNLLQLIYDSRFNRAQKIVEKLSENGIELDFDEIMKTAGENNYLGRPHISRALVDSGFCKDKFEAFDKYLGDKCFAFVPKYSVPVKEVIKIIRNAGGISVLAHPYSLRNDKLIYKIIQLGIDGMEVFYAKCNDDLIYHYNEMALMNNLIRTGGSDFHGEGLDMDIFESFSTPEYVLEEIESTKCSHKNEY